MKPVNLTKEERRRRREADIAAYRALTPEQQEAFIKERRETHTKLFQEKKAKEAARRAWQKEGIALLNKQPHLVFVDECPVMVVASPLKRDKETGEVTRYPIMKEDGDKEFSVTLAIRKSKKKSRNGIQLLHMAMTICSPKDANNARDAKAHLGHRMDDGAKMSIDFGVQNHLWGTEEICSCELEDVCWDQFTSFVRDNARTLPSRFVRSWLYKHRD